MSKFKKILVAGGFLGLVLWLKKDEVSKLTSEIKREVNQQKIHLDDLPIFEIRLLPILATNQTTSTQLMTPYNTNTQWKEKHLVDSEGWKYDSIGISSQRLEIPKEKIKNGGYHVIMKINSQLDFKSFFPKRDFLDNYIILSTVKYDPFWYMKSTDEQIWNTNYSVLPFQTTGANVTNHKEVEEYVKKVIDYIGKFDSEKNKTYFLGDTIKIQLPEEPTLYENIALTKALYKNPFTEQSNLLAKLTSLTNRTVKLVTESEKDANNYEWVKIQLGL